MKSQRLKDLYFALLRPIGKINHHRHRLFYSLALKSRSNGPLWLNIGSGERYLQGFINIEGNVFRKKDLWLDVRNGFPFPKDSIDGLYACHLLEHFYLSELLRILQEAHRVLKPGRGIRILVPSLEEAIHAYMKGEAAWYPQFPDSFKSLGGKFFNFILCDSQHRLIFDFSFMEEILGRAGFSQISRATMGHSRIFPREIIQPIEETRLDLISTSLIAEGIKT